MSVKESLIKLQEKPIVMVIEFVIASFIFILMVSFIFFASHDTTIPYCSVVPWQFPELPCPAVYGEMTYKEPISFMVFFLMTLIVYVIFVVGILSFMVIHALTETRRIDQI